MTDHRAVVEEAVSWVFGHPDERPSAEALAARFAYSPDHFARIFKAVAGEALGEFLFRQRLERAACLLLKCPSLSVTEIAAGIGYSSSNFAVAFRRRYGKSPSAFRADPLAAVPDEYRSVMAGIEASRADEAALARLESVCSIRALPAMTLYRERFRGRYADLGPAWNSFCVRVAVKYPRLESRFIGISYDDPLVSDPGRSNYDLCVVVPEGRGASFLHVPECVCAVYAFDDRKERFMFAFNELLAVWMPRHGLTLGDGPPLELYREVRPDGSMACDLCLPVRA